MDITLTCKYCGKKYVFTEGEINYYKQNKLSPPKKCPSCRKNKNIDIANASQKLGVYSQNIEDNPANQHGFFPVGTPHYYGPDGGFVNRKVIVYINDIPYYVYINPLHRRGYLILFLTSERFATHFTEDIDLDYLLKMINERGKTSSTPFRVRDYDLLYCNRDVYGEVATSNLKNQKHITNQTDIKTAQYKYQYRLETLYGSKDHNLAFI